MKSLFKVKFNTKNRIELQKIAPKKYAILVINSKKKVLEKIGSFNTFNNCLVLNIFRLIFWISKNYILNGKILEILILNFLLVFKKKFF